MDANKIFKRTIVILILLCMSIVIYYTNYLINKDNYILNGNTINKKSIMNAYWNMPFKEVQRVNNCKFKIEIPFPNDFYTSLINKDSYKAYLDCRTISLWSYNTEISYEFYNDRLCKYGIIGKVDNPVIFDSIAIKNLSLHYGKFKRSTTLVKGQTTLKGCFLKDSVLVEYKQFDIENENKINEHRFIIEVTYQPIYYEIKRKIEDDEKSIFN